MDAQIAKTLERVLRAAAEECARIAAESAESADGPADELLNMEAALKRFGIGRDGLLAAAARGELQLHRGPRRKLLVSKLALEAWLRSRPVSPRPRRNPAEVIDIDAWEREADQRMAGGTR